MLVSKCTALALLVLPSLLAHQGSTLFPHQRRRFLGRGLLLQYWAKPSLSSPPYSVGHVQQTVDHFNQSDTRTFSQRYLVYDTLWNKKGPIFVYTGNEGDIEWFFQNTGFVVDNLSHYFKALIIFIEHRYYGQSLPFGADSYKDYDHLQYLTSEQALADFVAVINQLKTQYNTTNPAIAVGGSYGGMLAAWLRMTYPETVIGAYSASAPIWWFSNLTPCNSAYQTITKDFSKSSPPVACADVVRKSWDEIINTAKEEGGLALLSKNFYLCEPLENMNDVENLMDWLSDIWFNLAMVDYPYPANFLEPLTAWPINVTCQSIGAEYEITNSILKGVAAGVSVYFNSSGQTECYNLSQTATGSLGVQGWDFQACTEMVMPMCSDGVNDMFRNIKWDLAAYEEGCMKQYGVKPDPNLIIKRYGGKDISKHSNILFSNGLLDPWSSGGVLHNVSDTLTAIVLRSGAHHLDLRAQQSNDPVELSRARGMEISIMIKWIEDYYRKQSN